MARKDPIRARAWLEKLRAILLSRSTTALAPVIVSDDTAWPMRPFPSCMVMTKSKRIFVGVSPSEIDINVRDENRPTAYKVFKPKALREIADFIEEHVLLSKL